MSKTCKYIWKTTSKKGKLCGRRIAIEGESYCYQHKPLKKNHVEPEYEPIIEESEEDFIQLKNSSNK